MIETLILRVVIPVAIGFIGGFLAGRSYYKYL